MKGKIRQLTKYYHLAYGNFKILTNSDIYFLWSMNNYFSLENK